MSSISADIESRLQRIEDIESIRHLRMQYHYCVNERIFRDAASLYTDDAYVDFETLASVTGRTAIAALFDRLNGNVDLIKQFVCNHMVTVDGDQATGIAYVDARYSQEGKSIMAAIRYNDKYRRTGDGWKFSEMLVKVGFAVPITQGWAQGNLNGVKLVET